MSKQSGKSLKQARIERAQPILPIAYTTLWIRRILGWSRPVRIVIATIFALATTTAVFPIVDSVYLANFFSDETRILPSFVAVGVGIIMYVVGWWLVVGTRGDLPPERIAVVIYFFCGVVVTIFVLLLIMNGYSVATLPDV